MRQIRISVRADCEESLITRMTSMIMMMIMTKIVTVVFDFLMFFPNEQQETIGKFIRDPESSRKIARTR